MTFTLDKTYNMRRFFLVLILFMVPLLGGSGIASAQTKATGLPLPRFVSLRSSEVNMRTGPGIQYPVEWVYHRQQLPMEVIAEYGTWRKVRDWENNQGWIHQAMLSGRRTVIVTGASQTLRSEANSRSLPIALLEPTVTSTLKACSEKSSWCQIEFSKYKGWLERTQFWGVYRNEGIE